MRTFFKSWRREFGMLTLALAILVVTSAIRSCFVEDQFVNYDDGCSNVNVAAGLVTWSRSTELGFDGIRTESCFDPPTGWGWYSEPTKAEQPKIATDFQYLFQFKLLGVEVATATSVKKGILGSMNLVEYWKFSLWSAVTLLALCSGYLFLSTQLRKKATPGTAADRNASGCQNNA